IEFLGAVLLRAIEHHVLEEVGDAGDAGPLVRRPHPEEAVRGAARQRSVGEQAEPKAVLQGALLDGEVLLRERHQSSLLGWTGFIISCSAGVISFLRVLQSLHEATTFPLTLLPPRATGTTWSMVSSR